MPINQYQLQAVLNRLPLTSQVDGEYYKVLVPEELKINSRDVLQMSAITLPIIEFIKSECGEMWELHSLPDM